MKTAAAKVAHWLQKHSGLSYCDDCLSALVGLRTRGQAQKVTRTLAMTFDYDRREGLCTSCEETKLVCRARFVDAESLPLPTLSK